MDLDNIEGINDSEEEGPKEDIKEEESKEGEKKKVD